jgi:hypothetical protein
MVSNLDPPKQLSELAALLTPGINTCDQTHDHTDNQTDDQT